MKNKNKFNFNDLMAETKKLYGEKAEERLLSLQERMKMIDKLQLEAKPISLEEEKEEIFKLIKRSEQHFDHVHEVQFKNLVSKLKNEGILPADEKYVEVKKNIRLVFYSNMTFDENDELVGCYSYPDLVSQEVLTDIYNSCAEDKGSLDANYVIGNETEDQAKIRSNPRIRYKSILAAMPDDEKIKFIEKMPKMQSIMVEI